MRNYMRKDCRHAFFILTVSLLMNCEATIRDARGTSAFGREHLNYFNDIAFLKALTYAHCYFIAVLLRSRVRNRESVRYGAERRWRKKPPCLPRGGDTTNSQIFFLHEFVHGVPRDPFVIPRARDYKRDKYRR